MNTEDLIKALARAERISQKKAKKIVKAFIDGLGQTLRDGGKLIFSNFGSFLTHKYPSKTIRDPRGRGHKIVMLPTNVIKWHPSPQVKKHVNKNAPEPEAKTTSNNRREPDKKDHEIFVRNLEPAKAVEQVKIHHSEPSKPEGEVASFDAGDLKLKAEDHKSADRLAENNEKVNNEKVQAPISFKELAEQSLPIKDTPESDAQPDNVAVAELNEAKKPDADLEKPASLTENEIGEITKSQNRPRISFEDFVKKTKDDILSSAVEGQPAAQPEKTNLSNVSPDEITPSEIQALRDNPEISPKSSAGDPYAGAAGVQFIDLSKTTVDKKILSLLPEKIARQYQVVPVADNDGVLTVAMIDPEDLETVELIKKQTGREVIPKLTVQTDLNRILDQYSGVEAEVSEAISQSEDEAKDGKEQREITEKKIEKITEDAPVSRIVTSLIKRGVRELASDIHIEPTENGLHVRFREDGVLQKKVTIPKEVQASVTSRIKILSGIKIDESRLPQDGRIQMMIDNRKVDFRVSTMPTAFGEKIVMRILDKSTGILSLKDLGLRGRGFDVVENSIHKSHGMTLVTGPTGSGKTTTLYAIIDRLLDVAVNIVTLEDPIEYQMPGINQSQVNPDINYTFANGLRSILRQDPDVVMIGEIRDRDTAEMAVNAALTGHVVLSTLHTNDSAGAGPRLIDMGVEPFLITSSLNTVIAQRLARKICKDCKKEFKVTDKEIEEVKKEIAKMPEDARKKWEGKKLVFYRGEGCDNCHGTGYKGRIGIYEVLDVNQKIQELLLARATSSKITEAAIADGMLTMKQEGIDKALDGLTSLEEVWRVTKD